MKVPSSNPLSSRLDRDALMMVSRDEASAAAYAMLDQLDRLQVSKKEVSIAGLSVLFAAYAERVGMGPDELYAVGRRILTSQIPHGKSMGGHRLAALQDFANLKFRSDGAGIRN